MKNKVIMVSMFFLNYILAVAIGIAFYSPIDIYKESDYYQIYRFIVTVVSIGLGLLCYKLFYQNDDSKKIYLKTKILAVVLMLYYIAFIFIQRLENITIWIPALIYLAKHFGLDSFSLADALREMAMFCVVGWYKKSLVGNYDWIKLSDIMLMGSTLNSILIYSSAVLLYGKILFGNKKIAKTDTNEIPKQTT